MKSEVTVAVKCICTNQAVTLCIPMADVFEDLY